MLKHKDYVKAAKDLMKKSGCDAIKVVAVKGDALKKEITATVEKITGFDYSTLEEATLDVLDDLGCEINESAPEKSDKKEVDQKALILDTAADMIDVLGYKEDMVDKFAAMPEKKALAEIQKMANEINAPYEEDGKTVQPDDTPDLFKPETIQFFADNSINVKWNEEEKEKGAATELAEKANPTKKKPAAKPKAKDKPAKSTAKDKPASKAKDKPDKKKKREKGPINMPLLKDLTLKVLKKTKKPLSGKEIVEKMEPISGLDVKDLKVMHTDGKSTSFAYKAAWARTYLKKDGLIDSPERGKWQISK